MVSFTEAFQTFYALRRDREQRKERARQGLADIGEEGRAQQTHQDTRRRDLFETMLTAFARGEEHIDELYPDDQEGQFNARRQLYDQTLAAMAPLGAAPEELEQVGNLFVETPGFAAQMLEGLRATGDENELQYSPRPVVDPRTGRGVYVAQGEEVGREPFAEHLRQENVRLREGELDRRRGTDDPSYQENRAAAVAAGRSRGGTQANLPMLRETFGQLDQRIGSILENPDLEAVTGLPSMRGLSRGGLGGNLPPVPGSPAAEAVVELKALASQIRLQAFNTLKGAGQITEAESLFGAEAQANLDRINSYSGLVREIERLRGNMRRALAAVEQSARTPTAAQPSARSPRRSNRPQGSLRNEGEDDRSLIDRLRQQYGGSR